MLSAPNPVLPIPVAELAIPLPPEPTPSLVFQAEISLAVKLLPSLLV